MKRRDFTKVLACLPVAGVLSLTGPVKEVQACKKLPQKCDPRIAFGPPKPKEPDYYPIKDFNIKDIQVNTTYDLEPFLEIGQLGNNDIVTQVKTIITVNGYYNGLDYSIELFIPQENIGWHILIENNKGCLEYQKLSSNNRLYYEVKEASLEINKKDYDLLGGLGSDLFKVTLTMKKNNEQTTVFTATNGKAMAVAYSPIVSYRG